MKILVVHNEYQQPGGEDVVVERETALLRSHGHSVDLYSISNHSIRGLFGRVSAALHVSYSEKAKNELSRRLKSSRPDIAHVHNWFPLLSPSIYDACREQGIPVVQTLHNFRITCAGGLLMRKGKICEDCISGSPYQGAIHGCYRESRVGSLPVAHMIARHRALDTWNQKVDRFIALTHFGKDRFVASGIAADRITVKPNFVGSARLAKAVSNDRPVSALYVGRLSHEKGVETLLRAWSGSGIPLTVAGDGPLMDRVRESGISSIRVVGRLNADEVAAEMSRASFLIVPSESYETFSLVVIEAFAQGLPVIASKIGSLGEIVEHEKTGLHFQPGSSDDLRLAAERLSKSQDLVASLGQAAQADYLSQYTPERNYQLLMEIYSSVNGGKS